MSPFLTCTFFTVCLLAAARIPAGGATSVLEQFEKWIVVNDRRYKDEFEKAARFEIFKDNLEFIESFNRNRSSTFELGLTSFADLTSEEFSRKYSAGPPPTWEEPRNVTGSWYPNVDPPVSMDWRTKGSVTPIKSQGDCGACWVFAAVAAVETLNHIKTGKLLTLSEQQVMDCTEGDACAGGGIPGFAYGYIVHNKGIALAKDYPYTDRGSDPCDAKRVGHNAPITGYGPAPRGNEVALKQAVASGPVSVAFRYDKREFQLYKGKTVYKGSCGEETDWHYMVLIGYGVESDGTKYWLVKNSWGTEWGDNGFGKIVREAPGVGPGGLCSIAAYTSQPIWN